MWKSIPVYVLRLRTLQWASGKGWDFKSQQAATQPIANGMNSVWGGNAADHAVRRTKYIRAWHVKSETHVGAWGERQQTEEMWAEEAEVTAATAAAAGTANADAAATAADAIKKQAQKLAR